MKVTCGVEGSLKFKKLSWSVLSVPNMFMMLVWHYNTINYCSTERLKKKKNI